MTVAKVKIGSWARTLAAGLVGLAAGLGAPAYASPGCDAVNARWRAGVSPSGEWDGLHILPALAPGDRLSWTVTSSGSVNTDPRSGAGFAFYDVLGVAAVEVAATKDAELDHRFAYTVPTGGDYHAIHIWKGGGLARLVARVTCQPATVGRPVATSLSPVSGPTRGGTEVTIRGTNLTEVTQVAFGAENALMLTVRSATELRVMAPSHVSGPVDVTVKSPAGAATLVGAFTFSAIAAPLARDLSASVPHQTATAIDLGPRISGPHTAVSIAAGPEHGRVSVSSSVVTYTPVDGYSGADRFTYRATGEGGVSAPATVSLLVAPAAVAPAPIAASASTAVAYDTPKAIPLGASITGSYSTVAIVSPPGHGDLTLVDDIATYSPANGYIGQDSFTYVATGPGGRSAPGLVSLTVAGPAAPSVAATSVAAEYEVAKAIDLRGSVQGADISFSIASPPTHGAAVLSGSVVTYTPALGFFGVDGFTYVATGRGGASAPARVSVTVAPPEAPAVTARTVQVAFETAEAIALGGSVSGRYTSLSVASGPSHGRASVTDSVVTYVPAAGYVGPDSLAYTASGPSGTSAPATVTLTIAPPAVPTVQARAVAIGYERPEAIDLGGSITGVHSGLSLTVPPRHGSARVSGDVVTYSPDRGYSGVDSFVYAATGPGGVSAPATVTLNVAGAPPPVAADIRDVAVPFNGSGTAIDLSPSIKDGSTVSLRAAPAHGTAAVQGAVVVYTPFSGYFGDDAFAYTASGPGGASAPATVSLKVASPPLPGAGPVVSMVDYNSPGASIPLSPFGVFDAVVLAAMPAHGSVSLAGSVAKYVPTPGYFGPDSFTYRVSGPGGVSAEASVSIDVGRPSPPTLGVSAPVLVNTAEAALDLPRLTSGVFTTYRIVSPPRHGVARLEAEASSVTPSVLVYAPEANFLGDDTVHISASGPGGDSGSTEVTFRVSGKAPDLSGVSAHDRPVTFRPTEGLVGGPFLGLTITRQPGSGDVEVVGMTLVYTPAGRQDARQAQSGPSSQEDIRDTSFSYAITLPFGSSAEGGVDVQVLRGPDVVPLRATTLAGVAVSVPLTGTASGGPFTAASVVEVSTTAGTATILESHVLGVRHFTLVFTPNGAFTGRAPVTYALENENGRTLGTVTITVEPRADPSLDPDVSGLVSAQLESVWRFTRSQTDNFHHRLEEVRRGGVGGVSNRMRLNLAAGDDIGRDPREALRPRPGPFVEDVQPAGWGADIDRRRAGADPAGPPPSPGGADPSPTPVGIWTAGAVDWGRRDGAGRRDHRMTTSGISGGVDIRVSDRAIVGAGVGLGRQRTEIGDRGTTSRAESRLAVLYGAWGADHGLAVEGVMGFGALDFESRRWASDADGYHFGRRSGSVLFGSTSLALERSHRDFRWSPYARLQFGSVELKPFEEAGEGRSRLAYGAVHARSLASVVGSGFDGAIRRRSGVLSPSLRIEWRHEFADGRDQALTYADWADSPTYAARVDRWVRDEYSVALGVDWRSAEGWSAGAGYDARVGKNVASGTVRLRLMRVF